MTMFKDFAGKNVVFLVLVEIFMKKQSIETKYTRNV